VNQSRKLIIRMATKAEFVIAMVLILSLCGHAFNAGAVSLATVLKKEKIDYDGSSLASTTILFITGDEFGAKVSVRAFQYPDGWDVFVQPGDFILSKSSGGEIISVNGIETRAYPVTVTINPNNATAGIYEVLLKADAYGQTSEPAGSSPMGVSQERIFKLLVNVTAVSDGSSEDWSENPKSEPADGFVTPTAQDIGEEEIQPMGGTHGGNGMLTGIYVLPEGILTLLIMAFGIIGIFVVSWTIYKHA
jgi:hypothetical protein